jgi:D-beta-D-heptose 7-phosphate kinase/D-beta-D-heptose 1-phosphate adenosyltransferase
MKIVLATGGFDPIHSGHIKFLKNAKELGDMLVVGINSDEWLERKKEKSFMPWNERLTIINNLQMVDEVFTFMDDDDSAINFIKQIKAHYPKDELIFVNGGDRTADNIPEMVFDDVEFVFGVGGEDKRNSSSKLLEEWKSPKTIRPWGYYRVLHEDSMGGNPKTKVKELTVDPGSSISLQRHKFRREYWVVTSGTATVELEGQPKTLGIHEDLEIPIGWWHRLSNKTTMPLRIVEIQTGMKCVEEDIERAPHKEDHDFKI